MTKNFNFIEGSDAYQFAFISASNGLTQDV